MIDPLERRKLYAAIAAQVELLRELITGEALFERLWYFAEVLPELVERVAPDSEAAAQILALDTELDELSLAQAQHLDIARQTLDMILHALRFATQQKPGFVLTPELLEQFYTTQSQCKTHCEALNDLHARQPAAPA
jgi:hypothetical protein